MIFGPILLDQPGGIAGWISSIGGISGIVNFILGRSGRARATSEQGRQLPLLDRILTHIATVAAVLFLAIFLIFLSWLTSKSLGWLSEMQLDHLETIKETSSLFILIIMLIILGMFLFSLIFQK